MHFLCQGIADDAGLHDPDALIQTGLSHARTEIRLAALTLLCRRHSPGAARLPSAAEADQLIEFVRHSMAEDDSRFRQAVLRIRIRIRIHMFLGLPDPDPLVRGMDPALDPDLFIIMQK
jgi:hypothetical protein